MPSLAGRKVFSNSVKELRRFPIRSASVGDSGLAKETVQGVAIFERFCALFELRH